MSRQFFSSTGPRSRRAVFEEFLSDPEMLSRYRVTDAEIDALKTFAPFGAIKSIEDIVFILQRIRRLHMH